MFVVFGELLPLALGVAVSPLPVMIVILMLIAPGGMGRAAAFVGGWLAGLLAVGGIVLAFVEVATEAEPGDPGTLGMLIPWVLGALLLGLAAREWRNRPGPGDAPALPGWMSSLDGLRPGRALALGFTFAAIKPKNLVLAAAAGTGIAEAGLGAGPSIVLLVTFALLATSTVATPLVATLATGDRAPRMLEGWRAWLEANNTVLTVIVLLVFGTVLIGKGLGSLG